MNLEKTTSEQIHEKLIKPFNGGIALTLLLGLLFVSIALFVFGCIFLADVQYLIGGITLALGIILFILFLFLVPGLRIVNPNEAIVLTLFGTYYGTIKTPGFYYVNPFSTSYNPASKTIITSITDTDLSAKSKESTTTLSKKVSIKTQTLHNEKQKVNDILGNPIIIGAIVIWKVVNPTSAVFHVENYKTYLSTQCDSVIRNISRLYPYDVFDELENEDTNERTLRGSSQEIADQMQLELQSKVENAGIEILEIKITHLSYAEEIAAAMLQRQQASAIISARQKIVSGAVGMVKMALDELNEEDIVLLDDERKAAMVSNLLVVLCGNKDAQPIVNSGSIY